MSRPTPIGETTGEPVARANVTVIVSAGTVGGHEIQLVELLKGWQSSRNLTVIVLTEAVYKLFCDSFDTVVLVEYSKIGKIWSQWLSAPQLASALRPHLPPGDEIVVSGGSIEACVSPARAIKLLRPDAMVTAYLPMYIDRSQHNRWVGGLYNILSKAFVGAIDRFITINRVQALLIGRHYGKPVSVIRNRINPFHRPATDHGARLIYVGRLDDQQKGVSELVGLLDDPANPFAELHIFGDGPDRAATEQAIARCTTLSVTMHGWMGHDDIQARLGARDLLVMNSRWEGEPMIVRELKAAGIDAVVTEIPGFRGILPRTRRYSTKAELLAILTREHRRLTIEDNRND